MDQYRITFSDDSQIVVSAGSVNQAIAAAVRQGDDRLEIINIERSTGSPAIKTP